MSLSDFSEICSPPSVSTGRFLLRIRLIGLRRIEGLLPFGLELLFLERLLQEVTEMLLLLPVVTFPVASGEQDANDAVLGAGEFVDNLLVSILTILLKLSNCSDVFTCNEEVDGGSVSSKSAFSRCWQDDDFAMLLLFFLLSVATEPFFISDGMK